MGERWTDASEGALVGTIVGDAVGAPYEGAGPVSADRAGDRVAAALRRGHLTYTDDSQMTLVLAEHLCEHPEVRPETLAASFLAAYEPWRGYGQGMRALVEQWRRGADVREAATSVFPEGSFGNGAAMRVAPVGVRWWQAPPQRLAEAARRSAQTTHVHPIGVDAAVAQARAVGLAMGRGEFGPDELGEVAAAATAPELRDGLRRAAQLAGRGVGAAEPREVATDLGNEVVAHRSVPAALWAAAVAESWPHTIELALAIGGDTDTIAAMAGAVRGAADGAAAIPAAWQDACEGVEAASAVARRLVSSAS